MMIYGQVSSKKYVPFISCGIYLTFLPSRFPRPPLGLKSDEVILQIFSRHKCSSYGISSYFSEHNCNTL